MMKVEDKGKRINYSKMSEDAVKAAEEAKKAVEGKKLSPPEKPKEQKKAQTVEPYLIVLTVKKLNVRKGPSAKSSIVSILSIGKPVKVVAELEEQDVSWGKLESGGWVNLQFTKKK